MIENAPLLVSAVGILATATGALVSLTWRLSGTLSRFESKTERYEKAAALAERIPIAETELSALKAANADTTRAIAGIHDRLTRVETQIEERAP